MAVFTIEVTDSFKKKFRTVDTDTSQGNAPGAFYLWLYEQLATNPKIYRVGATGGFTANNMKYSCVVKKISGPLFRSDQLIEFSIPGSQRKREVVILSRVRDDHGYCVYTIKANGVPYLFVSEQTILKYLLEGTEIQSGM